MVMTSTLDRGRGGSIASEGRSFIGKSITRVALSFGSNATNASEGFVGNAAHATGNRRTAALAPGGPFDLILNAIASEATIAFYDDIPGATVPTGGWNVYVEGEFSEGTADFGGMDSDRDTGGSQVESLQTRIDSAIADIDTQLGTTDLTVEIVDSNGANVDVTFQHEAFAHEDNGIQAVVTRQWVSESGGPNYRPNSARGST